MLFQRVIYYALIIGVLTGLMVTLTQSIQVIPIIQSAEGFETQASTAPPLMAAHNDASHNSHSHDESSWMPKDGIERTFYTFLANSFTAIGFSMLMLSLMLMTTKSKSNTEFSWKNAAAWSGAGYLVFFLAPSFGLPPEIPLANSALLEERQLWWSLTALSTAIGLAGLAFGRAPWRWAMPVFIILPHLFGAPHISGAMFNDNIIELEQLAQSFIPATAFVNAVLWLILGVSCTWVIKRIYKQEKI
ncbi:MAG: CbtA family protein [Gammaproteobacteria bacterium]|jgi:cobalt transporter subunit CbtA